MAFIDRAAMTRGKAFLQRHGAGSVAHPGGVLFDHLVRTAETLQRWKLPQDVVLAGLGHAVYGTDGFSTSLVTLDQRCDVATHFGEAAETIIYLYAACDRPYVYRSLLGTEPPRFRDRFSGLTWALRDEELDQIVQITVANELDVAHHSPDTGTLADFIARLVSRCRSNLPDAAIEEVDAEQLLSRAGTGEPE